MTHTERRTIPISRPSFTADDLASVAEPLASGWVVQGPFVQQFERDFAAYTAVDAAIASTSCTTALHLALAALGVGPGDEVIVPAFTWIATANVVEYQGARPVFCDIELDTFNIDAGRLESLITERTVGIIPVHLFGLAADMDPILDIARRHELWVVEDAACSFGGWYKGRHTGSLGNAGCFSFHPRKSITTGEGGMVTTNDVDLARLTRVLRDHGASRTDLDRHHGAAGFLLPQYDHLGFNYRMTDIQAALGCSQLRRGDAILDRRAAIAAGYNELLNGVPWLRLPEVPADYVHGWQSYVAVYAPQPPTLGNVDILNRERNALMAALDAQGISTRQGTHAVTLQGYYARKYGIQPGDFPIATLADRLSLSLPLFFDLADDDLAYVAAALQAVR